MASQSGMNKAAQALGKLAKGKPKTLTEAERTRRKESLAAARAKRWPVRMILKNL